MRAAPAQNYKFISTRADKVERVDTIVKISEIRCFVERVTSDSFLGGAMVPGTPFSSTVTALSAFDNFFGGSSAIATAKTFA